jgi:hypothetical protein
MDVPPFSMADKPLKMKKTKNDIFCFRGLRIPEPAPGLNGGWNYSELPLILRSSFFREPGVSSRLSESQ